MESPPNKERQAETQKIKARIERNEAKSISSIYKKIKKFTGRLNERDKESITPAEKADVQREGIVIPDGLVHIDDQETQGGADYFTNLTRNIHRFDEYVGGGPRDQTESEYTDHTRKSHN